MGAAAAADAAADAAAVTPLPAANSVLNRSETILKNAREFSNQNGQKTLSENERDNAKSKWRGEEERLTKTKKASPEGLSLTNSAGLMHNFANRGKNAMAFAMVKSDRNVSRNSCSRNPTLRHNTNGRVE